MGKETLKIKPQQIVDVYVEIDKLHGVTRSPVDILQAVLEDVQKKLIMAENVKKMEEMFGKSTGVFE